MKGFPSAFNVLVMKIVSGGKVRIKVNGEIGPYFNTHRGLRQGDPLSTVLTCCQFLSVQPWIKVYSLA
jgi:hypothetical protein